MPQHSLVPPVLSEISDFLVENPLVMSDASSNSDGRITSANDESIVTQILMEQFDIYVPEPRHWFDFSVTDNGVLYPVNIKLSKMDSSHDNLSCKLGIYYALTGQDPDFSNEIRWDEFFSRLASDIQENNKDYYFLVINKQNTSDVFICGLKAISSLYPNGNNLPFQCCLRDSHTPEHRTFKEACDFLLDTLARSVGLRAKIYTEFCRHFPQYVSNS